MYCRALMIRPRLPVTVAAANRGATYPLVYVNSSAPPVTGSPVCDTYPNSVASTGVLHGDAATVADDYATLRALQPSLLVVDGDADADSCDAYEEEGPESDGEGSRLRRAATRLWRRLRGRSKQ